MSTQTEILRLQNARNTIRDKLVDLKIATSTDKLDTLASKLDAIVNRGTVNTTVQEGSSYTIEPGYYAGGSVSGVAGGGNYTLQEKSITPTKKQQVVTPDTPTYYGLSSVTVAAIPESYQNGSSVTATADDVLANKIIVSATGETLTGKMVNNGAVSKTLDTATTSYTVPKGYHNGSGTISVTTQTKTATPSTSTQTISADSGKVLSSVTVAAIPGTFIDTSDSTATAANILADKIAYGYDARTGKAVKLTGTMVNNGSVSNSFDGLSATSVTIPAGYTSGGTITLTNDIETALAAI